MHLGLRRTSTFAPGLHALMLTSALLASSLLAVAAPSAANEVVPERTDSELRVEQRIAQHLSAHRAGHDLATLPRHHELDHYMRAWADHTADDVCDAYDSVYECIIDQAHLDAPEDVTGDTAVLQILPTVATDELSDGQLDQIADLAFSGLSSGHPLKASDGPTTAGIGVAHRTYVGSDAATYHNVIIYVVDGHHDEIVDGEVSAAPKPDELAPPADDEPIFAEPDHSHDCPDGAELPGGCNWDDPDADSDEPFVPDTGEWDDDVCHGRFSDIDPSSELGQAAACLADRGVAAGYSDGTFRPGRAVTRAQMSSFVHRAVTASGTILSGNGMPFDDPVDPTHADAVAALAHAGVVTGFGDGTFGGQRAVTRGQMATFLTRAAEAAGAPLAHTGTVGFPDTAGSTHEQAIEAIAEAGITLGTDDGTYQPSSRVTRGQMALFLDRWLNAIR
jgi:hypothetical protein